MLPGFVLLTHRHLPQIARLADRLTRLFPAAPIVIQHDASHGSLRDYLFASQMELHEVPGPRQWGTFDLVEGIFAGFARLLARVPQPDVLILLSGQCYPIKPASVFFDFFRDHSADAWLDARPVERDHAHPHFDPVAAARYFPPPAQRIFARLTRRRSPFDAGLTCYKGSTWLTLSRHAAERLLASHETNTRLADYYRARPMPDESYPHTILCNDPDLRISPLQLHHIRWPADSPHPYMLGLDDFLAMAGSSYLFARKFDLVATPGLLDRIDHELLGL